MQRVIVIDKCGYASRHKVRRYRHMARPQPSRPAETLYGVRVRNTSADPRSAWATFAKAAREGARLTQSELARRVGTDRTTVWRWETGRQKPENVAIVVDFARVTNIDLSEGMAAAGLVPDVEPPTEPTRQPDVEIDLIMKSGAPDALKRRMLERLHQLRTRDQQRRMEDLRWMLEQDA